MYVFFTIFCGQSPRKRLSPENPPVWLALDLYFCCVGQFGSIGKSTILVFYLAESKSSPVLVTWPPHGQDGFLVKVTLKHSNSPYFWSSAFSVHYRCTLYLLNLSLSRSPVN